MTLELSPEALEEIMADPVNAKRHERVMAAYDRHRDKLDRLDPSIFDQRAPDEYRTGIPPMCLFIAEAVLQVEATFDTMPVKHHDIAIDLTLGMNLGEAIKFAKAETEGSA